MYRVITTPSMSKVPAHVMGSILETKEAVKAVANRYGGLRVETLDGIERVTIQRHWRRTYTAHTMVLPGPSFTEDGRDRIALVDRFDPQYKGW